MYRWIIILKAMGKHKCQPRNKDLRKDNEYKKKKIGLSGLMLVYEHIEKHSKLPWECPSTRLSMVRLVIFQFN